MLSGSISAPAWSSLPRTSKTSLRGSTARPGKEAVPLRARARSSCFANLSVTDEICRGCLVGDVPAIVGSIDIVMGEIDR